MVGGTKILLLENPADEAQAIAVSDPGYADDKAGKKKPAHCRVHRGALTRHRASRSSADARDR